MSWYRRFAVGLMIMVSMNVAHLAFTWRDFEYDGMEQIGFPFVFFERGGYAYHQNLYYDMLAIDISIAFVGAHVIAFAIRDGWKAAFRRLHTWDVDDA